MKEEPGKPGRRSGCVLVAHVPQGAVLDPRLARLFDEARRQLGRPLTEAESRAIMAERAKLN